MERGDHLRSSTNGPTTVSLELPEVAQRRVRPNSCRVSPFASAMGPPFASRPSSSLCPGIAARFAASVNLSASLASRGSSNESSGSQPPPDLSPPPRRLGLERTSQHHRSYLKVKTLDVGCEIGGGGGSAPPDRAMCQQRLPCNFPPLKKNDKRQRTQDYAFANRCEPEVGGRAPLGCHAGLKPRFSPKKAPRRSGWIDRTLYKKRKLDESRFEKAFEVVHIH